jgi:hypothetical protein
LYKIFLKGIYQVALTIIIAKNVAGIDLLIDDLGILLLSGTTRILTDNFSKLDIAESVNLYTYVNSGQIVINNGTRDLSVAEGLQEINFLTELEETGNLIGGGTEVQQFLTLQHNNISYISVGQTTYMTVARFVFKGAYNGILPKFNCVVFNTHATRLSYIQLFDVTNNRQVLEKSFVGLATRIESVLNISGVTTSEAMFEVRMRSSNTADDANIYSFSIVYA